MLARQGQAEGGAMAYRAGYDLGVTFQLEGAGGATSLAITSWSWSERVRELMTTHTGSSGREAMIAGVLSGEGTVEANVDIAALPVAAAPGIIAGAKGAIVFDTGTTTDWTVHVMVTQLNFKSSVDGLLTYNFNVKFDSTINTYTRPVT
jgi:hypothetical protein